MRTLLCLAAVLAAAPLALAYNGEYEKEDYWSLEEDFGKNNEGAGHFKQGDTKPDYNSDDEVWYYLSIASGDDPASAEPLPFSGFSPRGSGWAAEKAPADETSDQRIDGYPFIVRGYGALEKQIFTHPNDKQDLIIAWQAPVAGRFSVESAYQRLSKLGNGQSLAWIGPDGSVLKEISAVEAPADDSERSSLEVPSVILKKGERVYLRIGALANSQEDMGSLSVRIKYLGR